MTPPSDCRTRLLCKTCLEITHFLHFLLPVEGAVGRGALLPLGPLEDVPGELVELALHPDGQVLEELGVVPVVQDLVLVRRHQPADF